MSDNEQHGDRDRDDRDAGHRDGGRPESEDTTSVPARGSAVPPKLRCPACRASQPYQDVCRRCGADLRLLVKIKTHIDDLVRKHEAFRIAGNREAADAIRNTLCRLDPGSLAAQEKMPDGRIDPIRERPH